MIDEKAASGCRSEKAQPEMREPVQGGLQATMFSRDGFFMIDFPMMDAPGDAANDDVKSKERRISFARAASGKLAGKTGEIVRLPAPEGNRKQAERGRKSRRKTGPAALVIDFLSEREKKAKASASKRMKDSTERHRIAQKRYQILKVIIDDSIDNDLIDQIHQFLLLREKPG